MDLSTVSPDNIEQFVNLVFDAIKGGNWWLLVALGLVLVVWLVRKLLGPKVPWLQTQAGGAILNLVISFGGALATVLVTGQPMGWLVALGALKVAFTAAGGWTLVKHLLTLLGGADAAAIKADAEKAGEAAAAKAPVLSITDAVKGEEPKQ